MHIKQNGTEVLDSPQGMPLPAHTKRLLNKVVLITGSTKGIGRSIAEHLAGEGARLVLNYARDADAARELEQVVTTRKLEALSVQADTANPADLERLFAQAKAHYGRIDVVIANAGIELIDVPFTDYTEEQYDRVFDLNTKGTFFTLQQAARHVSDNGRIILISSSTTVYPHAGFALYGGSKTAPKYFVEVLAKEVGARGVTVNTVIPGATDQAGIFAQMPADSPYKKEIIAATPLGRMGLPRDIADVVAFVASPQSGFITGHHFMVNGGAKI